MHEMHFASLIDDKLIHLNTKLTDIEQIYLYQVRAIIRRYHIPYTAEELVEKLMHRTIDESLLLPTGTAIPHLYLDDFDDTIVSICVPEKPIVNEHGTIRILFLVLSGRRDNSLYLHILQSIVRISHDTQNFEKLLTIKSVREFHKHISEGDFLVKRAITVDDVMSHQVSTVKWDATLEDLSNLFVDNKTGYYMVVDDEGRLVGEVSGLDYIMAGFPAYTKMLQTFGFMKTMEPFERLLANEQSIKVSSIMRPYEATVIETTSIFEALFLMNKYHRHGLPVVHDKKPVGVISFMDIFLKVIKG
jgi:CBS domain-containing protein